MWLLFFSLLFSCAYALSLEEKVGQLMMVHFHGDVANEEAKRLIQEVKVGGIVYYKWANELSSPEQVRELSQGLQDLAKENPHPIPLLIAVDQEGGRVSRLTDGFTPFPSNRIVGERGDPQLAGEIAYAIGQELLAVGINMNFAPVVDVDSNPKNPVIGDRSFSDQAARVAACGGEALKGYKEAGVIATLKHFPGHGDVSVDSHLGLPVVQKSAEELARVELLPFAKLASNADAIMTAHLLVPAMDPESCSTLSKKTLDYLREQLGFRGAIVTDSLIMEGVMSQKSSIDEVAISALLAGCDLLLFGGKLLSGEQKGFELTVQDIQRIRGAIVAAVEGGRISETRIDEAVSRLLALKNLSK